MRGESAVTHHIKPPKKRRSVDNLPATWYALGMCLKFFGSKGILHAEDFSTDFK